MCWKTYIKYHKRFLKYYFPTGCKICIYKDKDKKCDDFELVYDDFFTDSLNSNREDEICLLCKSDNKRNISDIIYEILQLILERYGCKEYSIALDVLNKNNFILRPKEQLFQYYVKEFKKTKNPKLLEYIQCIVELGIDEKYEYINNMSYNKYFNIYIMFPNLCPIISLLKKNGYTIYDYSARYLTYTNLGKFVILI